MPNIGLVRTWNKIVNFETDETIGLRGTDKSGLTVSREIFEDCLFNRNGFYFSPGAYMIRTADFFNVSRFPISMLRGAGQNWQMFLPILYHFDCYTISEVMYTTVAHSDSHSRMDYGYDGNIRRIDVYEGSILETLDNIIGMEDVVCENYKRQIRAKYASLKFVYAYANMKTADVVKYYKEFCDTGLSSRAMAIRVVISKLRLFKVASILARLIRH